jgi:purine-nucleoside phosphorylase
VADGLLLAAFPPELAGLDEAPPAGWRVALTGVGALAAAATTARLIAEERPSRILFTGTCGAYDSRLAVGDFLCASAAVAVSLDVLEGRAYRPAVETTRWEATLTVPFPLRVVAVPPGITLRVEGAALLATVAPAEHLELSGVFAAAHAAGIPVGAVLGVANRVGPSAHAEWKANHVEVSRALVAALRPVLAGAR